MKRRMVGELPSIEAMDEKRKHWGIWIWDDCEHDSLTDLLVHMLEFCGCGAPEDALGYIREGLLLFEWEASLYTKDSTLKEDVRWPAIQARRKEVHGSNGAAYFFYYWLDGNGFTEHGGSVPGWLSEKGKLLLAWLNKWYTTEE